MAPQLYTSPFPRLDLTLDEKEMLHQTAISLIDEAQELYEKNLWQDGCRLDLARWDKIKERNGFCVYHDRHEGVDTGKKKMHLLLTVGSMQGTLNDAMYGVVSHTVDDMRIKTAYVDDVLVDCAVLGTIKSPTMDSPFQSMTVRWFVKGIPLFLRPVHKVPDNLYLEATGKRRLSNGEEVGFHLMHSIAFPRAPPLPRYERFNMSLCGFYRAISGERVQAFMTSHFEFRDIMAIPFVLKSAADSLISIWKYAECAEHKKLAYLVRRREDFSYLNDPQQQASGDCCVCGAPPDYVRVTLRASCAICQQSMCRTCRVKRELALLAPDRQLVKHTMRFCVRCVRTAQRLDAVEVAQSEVLGRAKAELQKLCRRATVSTETVSSTSDLHQMYADSSSSSGSCRS